MRDLENQAGSAAFNRHGRFCSRWTADAAPLLNTTREFHGRRVWGVKDDSSEKPSALRCDQVPGAGATKPAKANVQCCQ